MYKSRVEFLKQKPRKIIRLSDAASIVLIDPWAREINVMFGGFVGRVTPTIIKLRFLTSISILPSIEIHSTQKIQIEKFCTQTYYNLSIFAQDK